METSEAVAFRGPFHMISATTLRCQTQAPKFLHFSENVPQRLEPDQRAHFVEFSMAFKYLLSLLKCSHACDYRAYPSYASASQCAV